MRPVDQRLLDLRPLHLREWPIFHALWTLGGGTALQVLRALLDDEGREHLADRHSVRAVLDGFVEDGYARSETSHLRDEQGEEIEIVTYFPVVPPEEALRTAWLQLRDLMLDHDRYLDVFQELVNGEGEEEEA